MSAPRQVTVAVLSWNGRHHLETCLPALAAQVDPGVAWEVLVLDNGSGDDTAAWVRRHHPEVRLIRSEANLGFCAGNNRLVAMAEGDAVAFLNNDTRPAPTWLSALVSALGAAPDDVAAVSGLLTDWEGARLDCARGIMTFDGHAFQLGWGRPLATAPVPRAGAELLFPTGANMLIHREAFLDAGGFDEDYFAYYDDVDLGWRVWSGGRRIVFAPDAVVRHRGGATSALLGRYHRGMLFERNSFRTVYKNYESGLWEQLMPAVLLTLLSRTQALLVENNRMGGLERAPQTPRRSEAPRGTRGAPRSAGGIRDGLRRALGRVLGRVSEADGGWRITDERTMAQFRALDFLLGHLDGAAEKRAAARQGRGSMTSPSAHSTSRGSRGNQLRKPGLAKSASSPGYVGTRYSGKRSKISRSPRRRRACAAARFSAAPSR